MAQKEEAKELPIHKKSFNFGTRKPMECVVDQKTRKEILNIKRGRVNKNIFYDDIWTNYLTNKWVYTYDKSFDKFVFYKQILKEKRIYQVVWSGEDMLGDGLYILYKADLYIQNLDQAGNRKNFFLMPMLFETLKGSFESDNFLEELLAEGWISKEEKELLLSPRKFIESIPRMDDDLRKRRRDAKDKLNARKREERRRALASVRIKENDDDDFFD